MRILSWVQSKTSGKHGHKKPDVGYSINADHNVSHSRKEEFSDWPQGLFAIGTFGNNNDNFKTESSQKSDSQSLTQEELDVLQEELPILLRTLQKPDTNHNLLRLNVDQTARCDDFGDTRQAKDSLAEKQNTITQKSFSFLVKKLLAFRGGFAPIPSLKDPIRELTTEKLLKAILPKKNYPQQPNPTPTRNYLVKKLTIRRDREDDKVEEKKDDGSKWDKTDSEFIVLEI